MIAIVTKRIMIRVMFFLVPPQSTSAGGDEEGCAWLLKRAEQRARAKKEATGRKGKGLFMPLRKAVTGMERGPDMSALLSLMQVVRARG